MSCKYCPYRAAYVEVVPPACSGSPPAAHFHQTPDILLGAGLVAAGAGRCRIITHWKLHQDTALWAASQLLHVTLVRCPAVVVACCRAAAKPGVHVPIRNGQQQARPVAGGRGKLYQCQGHAAGHWVDTHLLLSLSGHGMETETPRHPPMSPLNIDVVTLHRDA